MRRAEGLEVERGLRNKRATWTATMPCLRICGDWPGTSLGAGGWQREQNPCSWGADQPKCCMDWQALVVYQVVHGCV